MADQVKRSFFCGTIHSAPCIFTSSSCTMGNGHLITKTSQNQLHLWPMMSRPQSSIREASVKMLVSWSCWFLAGFSGGDGRCYAHIT